ncbi:endocytosis defective- protein [Scheffersomyces spartinae]|uniref:Actin cytoskeleton-regulatory complex protein END3 n=1 Tax=Scheffersomyces spartinae TaxID=45513 RepID=A0A9P7V658_9ASCO|nr:endocytosis defective- protein [Scheffersomyces spartinae]KAG7192097.1 endocytosis defective- protein [Scheffersomyces spartinae]
MPRLEEWEIKKYWEIFQGLKPADNKYLSGSQVTPVLKNSRLPQEQLSGIWELSDIDKDGRLDFEEFCITMRLIFDLVNGKITEVPEELPGWLIPSSKSHLIQANKDLDQNASTGGGLYGSGSGSGSGSGEDEDELLSNDFDWYISPTDKATYETIYNTNCDSYGRCRFDSFKSLYDSLTKVPELDLSSAWNLVNPKQFETIDKDQVLVFLHILNQRENGKRIPRGVPASLRATFLKEVPNYDLKSYKSTPTTNSGGSGKRGFAMNYLNKIGHSQDSQTHGTDFSVTEGTDWEEVRLKRELKDLETLLEKAQWNSKQERSSDLANVKYEFEQLLKYKQDQLNKSSTTSSSDFSDIKGDVELIEAQVKTLEEFHHQKAQELQQLTQEIAKYQ